MNKKVLTLCAGVLLVGGSAVFTVNAVNAGNGKAQTAYVVKANAEGVAGYELSVVEKASYTWSLVKIEGTETYYLSPEKGYFLASDGSIKSVATSKPEVVSIMDQTCAISFDGAKTVWNKLGVTLYLWTKEDTKLPWNGSKDEKLALATAKTQTKELVSDEENDTVAAYISLGESDVIATGSFNEVVAVNTWTLEDGKLSVVGEDSKTAYLLDDLSLLYNATEDVASFKYENGKLMQAVKGGYAQVYITSEGLTTNDETEGAVPAALYEVKDGEINRKAIATTVTTGTFVIAQAIEEEVIGDTKYVAKAIASVEAGAPGAEYGHIDGIVFQTDGTLAIVDDVLTARVPVYIYYTEGDVKYYLTPDETWSKDIKTVWTLVDGDLVSVSATPKTIKDVKYLKDGVISGIDKKGHDITIALSQTSLIANEIDKCELPLLSASEMDYNDYVMLGGETAPGAYFVIVQQAGQQANFLQYTGSRITNETALWKVTKQKLNDGRYSYIFTNRATGEDLNIDGYKRFIAYDYNGGVQLLGVDINGVNEASVVVDGIRGLHTSTAAATTIGFYRSQTESYTAHWLLHRYGSSFQLNFSDYKDYANKTWMGNEFNGNDLVPVVWNGANLIEITPDENDYYAGAQAFLLKKRGTNLYIALNVDKKWTNVVTDLINTGGYKFELLSEENVKKVVRSNEAINGNHYMAYFRINYLEGETEYKATNDDHDIINYDLVDPKKMDPYCIEVGADGTTWSYDIIIVETDDKGGNGHKDLFVTVNDRCENDDRKPTVSFYDVDENIVRGEDAQNNPLNYRYVNIAFKAGAQMQFNNGNNWVNLNGKVLGINEAGTRALPTEKEYFLFDKAEGQWAVSMTDAENGTSKDDIDTRKFTFTNRENPAISIDVTSMHYMGENTYAVEYASNYGTFGAQTVNGSHYAVTRDTLVITPAKGNLKLTAGKDAFNNDSYANWTKEDLQDKTF